MSGKLEIHKTDITRLEVDCIVNAANTHLKHGGGVCGAIFRAAGIYELQAACDAYGGCPTGQAVITPGFKLKAKHIIHAVGPVWDGGKQGEEALLKSCYQESLRLAMEHGCKTIAFPLISSGIYGYPKDKAWKAALAVIRDFQKAHAEYTIDVTMAVLDEEVYQLGLSLANEAKSETEELVFFWHEYEAYGCFSQWYPASFVVEGIRYCHAEQYMMAKKALLFGDLEYYVRIMHETDPKACKALGKKIHGFDSNVWDACSEEIVYHANLAKFQQNVLLRKELLYTGDALLAEASPYDNIWGIGMAADHPDSKSPNYWKGKNLLGKVLMKVRKQLINNQKKGIFTNPWLYTNAGREERLRLGRKRAEGIALHMLKKQKWTDMNAEETAQAERIACEVLSEMNFCKSPDGGYIDFEQIDLDRGIVINYDHNTLHLLPIMIDCNMPAAPFGSGRRRAILST